MTATRPPSVPGASQPIRVWRFEDAPAEYQKESNNGGDEDWLAHVPAYLGGAFLPWLESSSFGCGNVSRTRLVDGSVIYIGAHA